MTDAPVLLAARGVNDRVRIEDGDFFKSVPAGADAYILSHIITDWNDDQCLVSLRHIRDAVKLTSRLLIVELVLAAGDAPHPGILLDMAMLSQLGGQERTSEEFEVPLPKAGFRFTRVVETTSPASIAEAVPIQLEVSRIERHIVRPSVRSMSELGPEPEVRVHSMNPCLPEIGAPKVHEECVCLSETSAAHIRTIRGRASERQLRKNRAT